MDIQLIN